MSEKPLTRRIAEKHLEAMLAEAKTNEVPRDGIARTLLWMIIDIYRETRTLADIKSEFEYVTENLDPEAELHRDT